MVTLEPFAGPADKNRLLATLRGEIPDRVPHFEVLIEDQHVTKLLGRFAGNTLGVGGDPAKGSEAAEGVRPMFPQDYIELCRIIGQDAIALADFWTPIKTRNPDGSLKLLNDRSFKTRADLDRVVWPGEADLEASLRYVREYVAAARGTGIGVGYCPPCIFQTLYEFVVGMHDCMIMIMEDRDLLDELMSRSADYAAELSRRAVAEGIDFLFAADDFAFKSGLFVRPEVFEPAWRPHFDRLLAPAREANIPIIFHSDGRIDDAVEMLLDMGICGLTPMDPSGIAYRDYKKRYGHRVTFFGNIDITWPLATGTPADVERDVLEHMEVMKPGGRWVAGSAHSIVNYIPHENFLAMINAFHKHGAY
jgi:uroporphyrinogen decarboxylase